MRLKEVSLPRTYWDLATTAADAEQLSRRVYSVHRLRVEFGSAGRKPASEHHLSRWQRPGELEFSRSLPTTLPIPKIFGSTWKSYEKSTGGKMLAIAHNGNLSDGLMFDDVTLTTKLPLDRGYAERRMRWEPIYEVTQIKGDGETVPLLSPNDEFADYYTWEPASFSAKTTTPEMLPNEYAREALKRGLAYQNTTRRQSIQVRHDRLNGCSHLDSQHGGGQLLREDQCCGAVGEPVAL